MIRKSLLIMSLLASTTMFAQQEQQSEPLDSAHLNLDYEVDAVGAVKASGDYLPIYMVNNNHGKLSPNGSNGYLEGKLTFDFATEGGFTVGAGLDMMGYVAKYSPNYAHHFHIQQLYVDLGYKRFGVSVGEKEELPFLVDYDLSSGNILWSENSRPVGRVWIGTTEFVPFPGTNGWFNFYLDASYGRQFDGSYTQSLYDNKGESASTYHYCNFMKDPYIHRKNLFFQTKKDAVVVGMIGFEHVARYGGTLNEVYKFSSGIKSMVNAFFGLKGNNENVTNHMAAADLKLTVNTKSISVGLYGQRLVDDFPPKTPLFYNGLDGLWGLDVKLHQFKYVNHIVLEYLQTSIQESPVNANEKYNYGDLTDKYVMGDYYNDDKYGAWANYGMSNGSPLLKSPIYNTKEDNYPMFKATLVKAWHLGFKGDITDAIDYKVLLSHENCWGEPMALFNEKQSNFSLQIQASYRLKSWRFTPAFSMDNGKLYGNNVGFALKVSKVGWLFKK